MTERLDRFQELAGYTPLWVDKQKVQVVEEIASYAAETNHRPDPYYFLITAGKLTSPLTGKPVEDSVEKVSDIGIKELVAIQKIQNWAKDAKEGVAFWLSPPHSDRSSESKIIVSQIAHEGNQKILFNRAILFSEDAIDYNYEPLVSSLAAYSPSNVDLPTSIEDCRSTPILTDLTENDWIAILEKNIHVPEIWEDVRSGRDLVAKDKALKDAAAVYEALFGHNYPKGFDDTRLRDAVVKANSLGMFGMGQVSCPPAFLLGQQNQTASEFMATHSLKYGESDKFVKNCGNCGAKIGRKMSKGDTCPSCSGVYQGC
jgi:hypothetical protein